MAYFVDTGVLLRSMDRKDPQFIAIREALRILRAKSENLVTTTQNLREFWNVSTRPTSARGGYGRSVEQRVLESVFQVVTETPASFTIWRDLVKTHGVLGVQVHDANLVAIMQIHGSRRLVTLNPSDFQRYPQIEALKPQQIVALA